MSNQTFEEDVMIEDILAHYGVPNMKWGVWNDETKRKYGVLKGAHASNSSRSDKAPDNSKSAKPDTITSKIKQRYTAYKEVKAKAKAEEEARQKAAEEAAKKKAEEDAEYKLKYGVDKEQYEAIRQATLNSHDPRVIIKGMKFLSDEELDSKISRLEKEGQIKKMANQQRKDTASAVEAELKARQQTIPYRLGKLAVESVKQNLVDPTLKEASNQTKKALAGAGQKALKTLKEDNSVKQAKKETKEAASKVKDSTAEAKLEVEAARIKKEKESIKKQKEKLTSESEREKQVNIATGKALVEAINEQAKKQKKAGSKTKADED